VCRFLINWYSFFNIGIHGAIKCILMLVYRFVYYTRKRVGIENMVFGNLSILIA